jgi:hypothetical protein
MSACRTTGTGGSTALLLLLAAACAAPRPFPAIGPRAGGAEPWPWPATERWQARALVRTGGTELACSLLASVRDGELRAVALHELGGKVFEAASRDGAVVVRESAGVPAASVRVVVLALDAVLRPPTTGDAVRVTADSGVSAVHARRAGLDLLATTGAGAPDLWLGEAGALLVSARITLVAAGSAGDPPRLSHVAVDDAAGPRWELTAMDAPR